MNLLFVGDIVGPAATDYLAARLPTLRHDHAVDVVVVNGENCSVTGKDPLTGFGMSFAQIELLLGAGVDAVTSGNHAWDGPEADRVLAHPRVLRPHNLPPGRAGKGVLRLDDVAEEPVTIVNLADTGAIADALPVYSAWCGIGVTGTVVVDFHGDHFDEKVGFAFAVDGTAAAVLGTHTHEPTLPLRLLPGGTAFVADVGMTGPEGGWGGIDPAYAVARVKGEVVGPHHKRFELASGPVTLGAVLLRILNGRTVEITRIS